MESPRKWSLPLSPPAHLPLLHAQGRTLIRGTSSVNKPVPGSVNDLEGLATITGSAGSVLQGDGDADGDGDVEGESTTPRASPQTVGMAKRELVRSNSSNVLSKGEWAGRGEGAEGGGGGVLGGGRRSPL